MQADLFQEIDLSEIARLEIKMLPGKNRDRNDSPKKALSREEQLIYAAYLESINQPISAEYFRKEEKFK
jgi:hypothetical protein